LPAARPTFAESLIFVLKINLMAYLYTTELINSALTYPEYRRQIREILVTAPSDAAAEKMRPYLAANARLMDDYDESYRVLPELLAAVEQSPSTTWLVITEGWCGDAAFNVPLFYVLEKLAPGKIKLRLVLRDSNLELMDAHLTDGGRSIPKLIVLSDDLKPLGFWGPRPAGLQRLMKQWKDDGLGLKELIPKVHSWYDADKTRSLQQELTRLLKLL
jgi:hypothetical protein